MKSKEVIGFRASEQTTVEKFNKMVADLDVDKGHLAERAFLKGLFEAAEEIRREKIDQAVAMVQKLKNTTLQRQSVFGVLAR